MEEERKPRRARIGGGNRENEGGYANRETNNRSSERGNSYNRDNRGTSSYGNRRSTDGNYRTSRSGDNQDRPSYNSNNQDRTSYNSNNQDRTSYSGGNSYNKRPTFRSNTPYQNRGEETDNRGNNNYQRGENNQNRYCDRPQGRYNSNRPNNRYNDYNRNNETGEERSYGNSNHGNGGYQRGDNQQRRYNDRPQQGRNDYRRGSGDYAPRNRRQQNPEPILYKAPYENNETLRLNKYLSTAGVCSRREADNYISQGRVTVNGKVITELGTKILFGDVVLLNEKVIIPENKVYVLLNKPKDCVTTTSDPHNRITVMDIIRKACPERIFPVGRLDRNTTGVLLLTNDGELASKLTHPQYMKKKIYQVTTDSDVSEEDMQKIADGIELTDGMINADAISYVDEEDKCVIGIEIHSGRNRIVRRIFESLGYKVKKLDRVYFAGLTKKDVSRGRWRYLSREEVNMLHMGSFE